MAAADSQALRKIHLLQELHARGIALIPVTVWGTMPDSPEVEFLWWSGCPSWERALGELRDEMKQLGLHPEAMRITEVENEDEARRQVFVGSPTIRIDGVDLQPAAEEHPGLTCRLYKLRDGRPSPVPDRADLRDALQAAIRKREDEHDDNN